MKENSQLEIAGRNSFEMLPGQTVSAQQIEQAEEKLLEFPQIDCELSHKFAPGVYIREVVMPAGAFVIGHRHKHEHFNIALSGRARVFTGDEVEEIIAPKTFVSKAGVKKMFYIFETMRWATVHAADETDLDKLEDYLFDKSEAHIRHKEQLKTMQLKGAA